MNCTKQPVGQVMFDVVSADDAVRIAIAEAHRSSGMTIRLANAWCVVSAESDPVFARALNGRGWTFPDGASVTGVLRLRGIKAARVRGPSFFESVLDRGRETAIRHYFLGATPGTLSALTAAASRRYAGVTIVGSWAPPFGPVDEALITKSVHAVLQASPDIVWIGLGTPKQDVLAQALAARTGTLCIGVGAAFDFVGGTVREAPKWMQWAGLEWLFRLASEPRRLWRRYLVGNLRFLQIAVTR